MNHAWSTKQPTAPMDWSAFAGDLNHAIVMGATMQLQNIRERMRDTTCGKSEKERLLKEARSIADLLKIDIPNYNTTEFSDWLRKDD